MDCRTGMIAVRTSTQNTCKLYQVCMDVAPSLVRACGLWCNDQLVVDKFDMLVSWTMLGGMDLF